MNEPVTLSFVLQTIGVIIVLSAIGVVWVKMKKKGK